MKKLILASALVFGLAASAQAGVLTFDDIGTPGGITGLGSGFVEQGFRFSANSDVVDVSPAGSWSNGVGDGHSGHFAALNDFSGDMDMTKVGGGTFSAQSLWLNGWQGAAFTSHVQGLLNGVVVGDVAVTYSNPWQLVNLGFTGIDTLRVSGGIFLVDDITVNAAAVPEPGSLALVGLGLAGAAALRRRKQKA
ncbi:PEP-CTERM sorting domain-containing protein [Pseudoduganella sp. RAF53_2]|uniref:PEP-CTERM sorting domain-containing protein n=1 Tax=unclassified Pseudoduganella TaxID=2637179 RepID=UPI003F9833FA